MYLTSVCLLVEFSTLFANPIVGSTVSLIVDAISSVFAILRLIV